jgi:hypothetical protein
VVCDNELVEPFAGINQPSRLTLSREGKTISSYSRPSSSGRRRTEERRLCAKSHEWVDEGGDFGVGVLFD